MTDYDAGFLDGVMHAMQKMRDVYLESVREALKKEEDGKDGKQDETVNRS